MEKEFQRCLVGGTFDRFHAGHAHLLDLAASRSQHVEVWLTDDEMAADKSGSILDMESRLAELDEWHS